jgi:preprotein translocase SecE subunit
MEASGSIGRAADSKSAGWGFESLLACHVVRYFINVNVDDMWYVMSIKGLTQYFSEVVVELSHVEWPTYRDLIGSTVITLILVSFFIVYLGGVDTLLALGIGKVLSSV